MEENKKNDKYQILEELGRGAFGSAYKVLNKKDNNIYVMKKIITTSAENEELKKIQNEAQILSKLNSENIVKYFESFHDNNSFNIIMEYCEGLDLRTYIIEHRNNNKLIDKNIIYHIIYDICLGLKEIHNNNLIHRDLKPDNLFISEDLRIKIGDFGISKQLNSVNEYAKTKIGTMLYMAPEILKGEQYNNKVDIWSLGCIIHELCVLNFCFDNKSFDKLLSDIKEAKHDKINEEKYGIEMQSLIDLLLNKNYINRPNIEEILQILKNNNFSNNNVSKLFEKDDIYQNYILENNLQQSLDQINLVYSLREPFYKDSVFYIGLLSIIPVVSDIVFSIIYKIKFGQDFFFSFFSNSNYFSKYYSLKNEFIKDNIIIITIIKNKFEELIKSKFNQKIFKEKIFIYNKETLNTIIEKIKEKIISTKYINKLKKTLSKNFNILLIGNTNVGKSTLINEFLKLDVNNRAKESDGGPTDTIDFTPYIGQNNNNQYTLFDTNGITNNGDNSIENKIENTIKEIIKRIESKNPNKLIHCIWYCITGSNIQPSDKDFIEKILNVYTTFSIPIIFVHTKTILKKESATCKKGIEKYLLEICNGDKIKVKEYLKNYINILARGDEDEGIKANGLDQLESISKKQIEIKGLKSAYFEYIKRDIIPILINGIFSLVFNNRKIRNLTECANEDLNKYLSEILKILYDDKLGLNDDIIIKNKIALNNLYNSFSNIKDNMKDDLNNILTMDNLKKDNEEIIKKIYDSKNDEYKKKLNFKRYLENVESFIYENIIKNSKIFINNLINVSFNYYLIQIIKEGIQEQFKAKEKEILSEIYSNLFKK